ncbi:hypothetical protein D3C76_1798780 [compost metagenome]
MRAFPDLALALLEELGLNHLGDLSGDFRIGRHQIAQKYGIAMAIFGHGLRL